jgi:hypothetical protein
MEAATCEVWARRPDPMPLLNPASETLGSEFLRTLIGDHPELCASVALHLLIEFCDWRDFYVDLGT